MPLSSTLRVPKVWPQRGWDYLKRFAYLHNFGLLAAFGDAQNWHLLRSSNYSRLAGQNEPLL